MTPGEARFMKLVRKGTGWFAPTQSPMIRRMMKRGWLRLTTYKRYNRLRGTTERFVELGENAPEDER